MSKIQTNESFGEELEADLLAEGEKLGPVEKITVFPKNPVGPVVIKVCTYGPRETMITASSFKSRNVRSKGNSRRSRGLY